jgi:hypothetical protein
MKKKYKIVSLAFGKYKGKRIEEIDDLSYLGFLYFEAKLSRTIRPAILKQAKELGDFRTIKEFRENWNWKQCHGWEEIMEYPSFEFWKDW